MKYSFCAARFPSPSRPSPSLQPATRKVAGFRMPFFGPPCIREALFRHRGAPVSGSLRPSATVAAWQPGPAAPDRGKASIPPGVHPCPENGASPKFSARFSGVNRPGFLRHRSGSRLAVLSSNKLQQEAATAPEISVTVAARSAPRQFSPDSPPSHQR